MQCQNLIYMKYIDIHTLSPSLLGYWRQTMGKGLLFNNYLVINFPEMTFSYLKK